MKTILQIMKWAAYLFAGPVIIALIGVPLYRVYLEKSTKIETPDGISLLEEITLDGLKQWIFIRGADHGAGSASFVRPCSIRPLQV